MCGIAGIVDLSGGRRMAPAGALRAMADAIVHRGPDEDGYLERPGVSFASRRLSIVGLFDGQQPIHNEDSTVSTVFNGELFDYPEMKADLEKRGHVFRTHCDTELIPHTYEDHPEALFEHLRGQFAVAVYDRARQRVWLGRDRFGICPLYWTRQRTPAGDWLLFASEIKALLASGMVEAKTDPRGLNHVFTFFALPGPVTCFKGISYLQPGHCLRVDLGGGGETGRISEHVYWRADYPNQGDEDKRPGHVLVEEFERVLLASVQKRLRADVPVVSYLSGGVDSSVVVAMASKVRGSPIPCFTIRIKAPNLDETTEAGIVAKYIGAEPIVVDCGAEEVRNTYPKLIEAAEAPVIDTSCAALLLLSKSVHEHGYKVALTGEGSDEWLAGYPWHKINRALGCLDFIPGLPISMWIRRLFMKLVRSPRMNPDFWARAQAAAGGHNGWLDLYGLMTMGKLRFFSQELLRELGDHVPHEDLGLNRARLRHWHPLNRELHFGAHCHLVGLLLAGKGDRVAMDNSVETRYPFLDEDVFRFTADIDPSWKLRRIMGDKLLLRKVAERWLPREIAWRAKAMFRAPFDSFHLDEAPPFVDQLLSEESLKKTGYFDVEAVTYWRKAYKTLRLKPAQRASIEMGLVGVLATQLWHHTYLDGTLADLPSRAGASRVEPRLNGQYGHEPVLAGVR
jgi:asparagine synthase (glutamine-hydrolysing)